MHCKKIEPWPLCVPDAFDFARSTDIETPSLNRKTNLLSPTPTVSRQTDSLKSNGGAKVQDA